MTNMQRSYDQRRGNEAAVPDLIARHLPKIASICREHDVRTLYIFGSAVNGDFDPVASDIDFQVDLGDYEPAIALRYAQLYNALRDLLERDIDLITTRSRGSSRFLSEVAETRKVVYAS